MANESWLNNPIVPVLIIVLIGAYFLSKILKRYGVGEKFKEFKPQLSEQTVYDDIVKSCKMNGTKVKGSLHFGFKKIATIEKYFITKGHFPIMLFNQTNKSLQESTKKPVEYELMIIQAKNNNLLFRILHIKKQFFILDNKTIQHDPKANRIIVPSNISIIPYGNIWVNSASGVEFTDEISLKRQLIQTNTIIENTPDRVIHLETETARKERIIRNIAELEKGKYDDMKKGKDTEVKE